MAVLRTTTTKMGLTIKQLTWPINHMTFEYGSPTVHGSYRGRIEPVPQAGWQITVFNPGRNLIPNVENHEVKNLSDAVAYVETHIRNMEKSNQDAAERTTKQDHAHNREIHTLFTPKA